MSIINAPVTLADSSTVAGIEGISLQLRELASMDWVGSGAGHADNALLAVEAAFRALTALQTELINASQASGTWALDGHRSFTAWLSDKTGVTRSNSSRITRLSQSLRDHLPVTRVALRDGQITTDHANIIARTCTKTDKHRELLADPECGEAFLISSAKELQAGQFAKVASQWATMSDPEAADRGWREENSKEEVLLSPTIDGYLLSGWLSTVNGAIVEKALNAHMGRKAADDRRSPKERRAQALTDLARYSLDTGEKQKYARIRPHLTVTVEYETLVALSEATTPVFDSDPLFPSWVVGENEGPQLTEAHLAELLNTKEWMETWQPGDNHVIASTFDYTRLDGVKPASLEDGTAIPPGLLSRLTCESMIARVVFGAESTVLDSGREERIFPAHQVRAIIARDRHCQYPGCETAPEFGEIHHSAEWFKHKGTTHVDLGILLCWFHHGLVHERGITILRLSGKWVFMDRAGYTISPPDHSALNLTEADPPPF